MDRIDLHIHSTASDGVFSLNEIVQKAKEKNLKAIAITDHDTVNPELNKRIQTIEGLEVVTGTEVKCHFDGIRMEMYGYFIDPKDNELGEIFEEIHQNRIERIKKIMGKFNSLDEDIKLDWRDIIESAEGSPGRPHVARELMKKGVVESIREAFDKYLADDKKCYVRLERPEYSKLIDKIHQSGGLAVLAHSASKRLYGFENKLKTMKKNGLDGVEVFYDYSETKKPRIDTNKVERLTEKYNLLKTGGSDFHDEDNYAMGEPKIPYSVLEKMKEEVDL